MNVAVWADRQLERFGDFPTLVGDGQSLTSFELQRRVSTLAQGLLERGLEPGQSVVLRLPNGVALVEAFGAVQRAGGVPVVVQGQASPESLSPWLTLEGTEQLEELRADSPLREAVVREPEELAQLLLTSGTTGAARLVPWHHAEVDRRYTPFADRRPKEAPVRTSLCALPMSSSFGAQYLYLRMLQKMRLVVMSRFEPADFLALVEEHAVQATMLVPTMCEALLALPEDPARDLSSLRSVLVGGSRVSSDLMQRFQQRFGVPLTVVYGLTELGPVASSVPGDTSGALARLSSGLEVTIQDPAGTRELEDGKVGRVTVRRGRGDPFVTRDLGYRQPDGALVLVGRADDVIIQGGHNIYPEPMEEKFRQHPDVAECAVVGEPHDYLGEQVVVRVVPCQGRDLDEQALLEWYREKWGPGPSRVVVEEELPRNALGKLQRSKLRPSVKFASGDSRGLRAVLAELMGDKVRFDRTFAELGLNSLAGVALVERLGERLGRRLEPTLLFKYPTPKRLISYLSGEEGKALTGLRSRSGERVAVIAAACRLPGRVNSPEEFWQALTAGRDFVQEVTRWDLSGCSTNQAALLTGWDGFDREFFHLSASEARVLERQHRLLLEVAWWTLERAGYAVPHKPVCGAFVGMAAHGSRHPLGGSGMAVGRLCHLLDLRGPAAAVDTTCSSGLVAVHQAARALAEGECDLALAGGVHLIAGVESFQGLSKMGLLAPDGRCKGFDASADGFGRGEGCVLFLLKREEEAYRDGDTVMAVLSGTALNNDGRSASLTAPNGLAQQAVLRQAVERAGLEPEQIAYLEAHATGTALGDPVEVEAAVSALRPSSSAPPLMLGSVKSNMGHLESAAGAVGLLKAVLAVSEGEIPKHLHFERLNPALQPWSDRFRIATSRQPLEGPALVFSAGMSGTNAAVVVEPAVRQEDGAATPEPHLFCLSAPHDAQWGVLMNRTEKFLGDSQARAVDLSFTSTVGRTHFSLRSYTVGETAQEMAESWCGSRSSDSVPEVVFLCTGQGVRWRGAGHRLLDRYPVFRESLEHCHRLLGEPFDLLGRLYEGKGEEGTEAAQPVLFALEWSLARLWSSWGIEPDVLLGHSLGELVAACLAGVFPLEVGLEMARVRGALMASTPVGSMLALELSSEEATALFPELELVAVNGARRVVMGGGAEAVEQARSRCGDIKARILPSDRAFHTSRMDGVLEPFLDWLKEQEFHPPRLPIFSSALGRRVRGEMTEPSYWSRAVRSTVRYGEALSALRREFPRARAFVELGPYPVLLGLLEPPLYDLTPVPSLHRDVAPDRCLLESLGKLYLAGCEPRWEGLFPQGGRRVPLPGYPFLGVAPENSGMSVEGGLDGLVRSHLRLKPGEGQIHGDQSFLELGLDSLGAVALLSQIERYYGVTVTMTDFLAEPTFRGLESLLGTISVPHSRFQLSSLSERDRTGAPLLCFPGADGWPTPYLSLHEAWPGPVYACSSLAHRATRMEELASQLVSFLEDCPECSHCCLFGWSFGAWLAHAVVGELESRGRSLPRVYMVDPPRPGQRPTLSGRELARRAHRRMFPDRPLSKAQLDDEADRYERKLALLAGYEPGVVRAPLRIGLAAGRSAEDVAWEQLSSGGVSVEMLGGDHFSVLSVERMRTLFGVE